jgi:hypothetical protein
MEVLAGSTDITTYFNLRLAVDGTSATGLTISELDLQYVRSGVVPVAKVDAVALAATDTAHTDNRAIEIDAIDQPGLYRVDWPDAAFAAGVREVIVTVKHTTCFIEHLRVNLTPVPANVETIKSNPVVNGGTITFPSGATLASTTNITAGTIATVTNLTNLPTIPANWLTAAGTAADFTTEIQAGLATAASLATAQTSIDDLPTNAELATALGTADDAILVQVALVKAKTDNLPSDPADQSLIVAATDALATLIGGVPTNAELATALGTADDAVLAQVALVKAKTDLIPASPASTTNITAASGVVLAPTGVDLILVESGITAGAGLTNDTGAQLTGINLRQALSLKAAGLTGVLAGAGTTNVTIKPTGKPAGNTRINATVTLTGNRTALTLKVPD